MSIAVLNGYCRLWGEKYDVVILDLSLAFSVCPYSLVYSLLTLVVPN